MIALSRLSHIHTFCPPLFSAVLLRLILCLENKFCPSFLRLSKKSFRRISYGASLAVGRFAGKQGSLRSPGGRLVASLQFPLQLSNGNL